MPYHAVAASWPRLFMDTISLFMDTISLFMH